MDDFTEKEKDFYNEAFKKAEEFKQALYTNKDHLRNLIKENDNWIEVLHYIVHLLEKAKNSTGKERELNLSEAEILINKMNFDILSKWLLI